jgi:hypothetical protein
MQHRHPGRPHGEPSVVPLRFFGNLPYKTRCDVLDEFADPRHRAALRELYFAELGVTTDPVLEAHENWGDDEELLAQLLGMQA